jgi:hypothetical protein
VTDEERKLLDSMARKLGELTERVAGMEIVLSEFTQSRGQPDLTTARLRIRSDLLKLKGTPSATSTASFSISNEAQPSFELIVSLGETEPMETFSMTHPCVALGRQQFSPL